MRRIALVVSSFGITAVLLWWALRGANLATILDQARGLEPLRFGLAVLLVLATIVLRAWRWKLLLPLESKPSLLRLVSAMAIGLGANNVMPARAGELLGPAALARTSGLRLSVTGSTSLVSRVMDVGALSLLAVVSLFWTQSGFGRGYLIGLGGVALGSLVVLMLSVRVTRTGRHDFGTLVGEFVLRLLGSRGERMAIGYREAVANLRDIGLGSRFWSAVALTVLVWLVNAGAFTVGFRAFDVELGLDRAIVMQGLIALAILIPSAPGFFGPFEAAARLTFSLYGDDIGENIATIVPFHVLVYFLPVVIAGGLAAARMSSKGRRGAR